MKEENIHLIDLDFEYKIWKNHLEWFMRDLKIIRDRNYEISGEHGRKELNSVEEMILDEWEDQLKKMMSRIKTREEELQYYNKDFPVAPDHQYFKEHVEMRIKMEKFSIDVVAKLTDLINELRV
ncbi:MAG: hypothetical protein ACOC2E_09850 [Bacteroidota bacterium]